MIIVICPVVVLTACALPANVVVLVPDESGTVGQIVVTKGARQEELSGRYAAIDTAANSHSSAVFTTDSATVEAAFAGALAAKPRPPAVYVVFFLIGEAKEDPGSADTLAAAVTAALATSHADISVVGHSDAIGDDAENEALSLRRAKAVYDTLTKGGVRASAFDIDYYGSNNPLVPTPRGVPEPRNRRVEITIR